MFRCAIVLLCAVLLAAGALAADVSLAWDHSISEAVTGYRIYYGPSSRTYRAHDEVPYQTTWTVKGLAPGTWYFAATAIDSAGNESEYSNEVSTTIEEPQPALAITSLAVSMRWFGVVLLCVTNANAKAILRYTDLQSGERQTVIATPEPIRTQHRVVLYLNMGAERYYKYEWTVEDAAGHILMESGTFQIR